MAEQYLNLPVTPRDAAFGLMADFEADTHPQKVSLIAGAYRDEGGSPWILPSVKKAKARLKLTESHEYLNIDGSQKFVRLSQCLTFGSDLTSQLRGSMASIQTVAGTGANHMAALFLAKHLRPSRVFIASQTWINHKTIWKSANVPILEYPYYDQETKCVDLDGMLSMLDSRSEPCDVIVLQACAHNPTGVDFTRSQWSQVAEVVKRKRLFVVFDSAYQGFASGDVEGDAWAVRYFLKELIIEGASDSPGIFVTQSFSKNFGLYGERVGALHLVVPPQVLVDGARSALASLARAEYSNPPRFGAKVVETILSDEVLKGQWQNDLITMSSRIKTMRRELRERLEERKTPGDWSHIESQIGMFSYTGLTVQMVDRLRLDFHIYLLPSGRASICGLNANNVEYVARAIGQVVLECIAE